MTREEAIERIKSRYDKWALDDKDLEAIQCTFPELAESEDEKIRQELMCYIQGDIDTYDNMVSGDYDSRDKEDKKVHSMLKRAIAYLEKQKDNTEKEYVFRPLAGIDITIAAEQAIRSANEGDRLVLAFNGAFIPVRKGCDANKIVDIYDAFIEKQKEASKAIEAVDRIDKYIDEHLANAHDMKDSNPDKKYYRGWDDALGEMAGILQDVYSNEKQKGQKPEEWNNVTINGEPIPTETQSVDISLAEWSEDIIQKAVKEVGLTQHQIDWFKTNVFPPKQEWSEEDEKIYQTVFEHFNSYRKYTCSNGVKREHILSWLKSLRPQKNISYGELPLVSIDYMEGLDTEFEKQVGAVIASAMNREHQFTSKYIKWVAQGLLECAKREQNSAEEYVSENFDDIWTTEECDELISEGNKLTPNFKKLFKNICHAWYDKGIEKEKKN